MIEYRRKAHSDVWHWCTNCSNWPAEDYETRLSPPPQAKLCAQCAFKRVKRTCVSCELNPGTAAELRPFSPPRAPVSDRSWHILSKAAGCSPEHAKKQFSPYLPTREGSVSWSES